MSRFLFGCILVIIASFTSGLAGTVNEFLLKNIHTRTGFFSKSAWTYEWGVLLNLLFILHPTVLGRQEWRELATLRGFDSGAVWLLIVVNASCGLTVGMILKYFDNIVKCFGNVLMVYLVTLITYLFVPDAHKAIDGSLIAGITIYALSSYMYSAYPYKRPLSPRGEK